MMEYEQLLLPRELRASLSEAGGGCCPCLVPVPEAAMNQKTLSHFPTDLRVQENKPRVSKPL